MPRPDPEQTAQKLIRDRAAPGYWKYFRQQWKAFQDTPGWNSPKHTLSLLVRLTFGGYYNFPVGTTVLDTDLNIHALMAPDLGRTVLLELPGRTQIRFDNAQEAIDYCKIVQHHLNEAHTLRPTTGPITDPITG